MADHDKKAAEARKDAEKEGVKRSEEALEHGHAEDALTDDQRAALEAEQATLKDAEKLQKDDSPEAMKVRRTQV